MKRCQGVRGPRGTRGQARGGGNSLSSSSSSSSRPPAFLEPPNYQCAVCKKWRYVGEISHERGQSCSGFDLSMTCWDPQKLTAEQVKILAGCKSQAGSLRNQLNIAQTAGVSIDNKSTVESQMLGICKSLNQHTDKLIKTFLAGMCRAVPSPRMYKGEFWQAKFVLLLGRFADNAALLPLAPSCKLVVKNANAATAPKKVHPYLRTATWFEAQIRAIKEKPRPST